MPVGKPVIGLTWPAVSWSRTNVWPLLLGSWSFGLSCASSLTRLSLVLATASLALAPNPASRPGALIGSKTVGLIALHTLSPPRDSERPSTSARVTAPAAPVMS
jgi:hypothetical protein